LVESLRRQIPLTPLLFIPSPRFLPQIIRKDCVLHRLSTTPPSFPADPVTAGALINSPEKLARTSSCGERI
jgi:hypothetical protein